MLSLAAARAPLLQVIIVIITSIILTYTSVKMDVRGPINAIWLVLLPLCIALICNRQVSVKILMVLLLVAASWISSVAWMAVIWGGY